MHGQLGLGDTQPKITPVEVKEPPSISSLSYSSCADNYFQVVDCNGDVWSCGKNFGQMGLGDSADRINFSMIEALPKLSKTKSARNL